MKFNVTGYSKGNGAKVNMEMEASSKADAERKAVHANVEVTRVEQTGEVDPHNATLPNRPAYMSPMADAGAGRGKADIGREKSRRPPNPLARFFLILIFAIAVATAAYYNWEWIKQHVPGLK
jgi:hypothetical protein